jgi:hypothetical protein
MEAGRTSRGDGWCGTMGKRRWGFVGVEEIEDGIIFYCISVINLSVYLCVPVYMVIFNCIHKETFVSSTNDVHIL